MKLFIYSTISKSLASSFKVMLISDIQLVNGAQFLRTIVLLYLSLFAAPETVILPLTTI